MNKPRTVTELLAAPDMAPLEQVLLRSKHLRHISTQVKKLLGPELSYHCQVANVRDTTLIMAVTSTVWATRLRYQLPNLLQQFQHDTRLNAISDIQIRVIPESRPQSNIPPRRASMSVEAAYGIQQFADSLDDERLRNALSRLASRQSGRD